MNCAVYSGTRNLYRDMETGAKSLVANSKVDKIYFLIEDAEFPRELPDMIECINVSEQTWFSPYGINMKSRFTYMALIRSCYEFLFPKVDRILQLDCDTVCVDDVDYLFDVDLQGNYVAMCEEVLSTYKPYGMKYYNCGVAVEDLKAMRKIKAADQMVALLSTKKLPYIDQDAINYVCNGKIFDLPTRYNEGMVIGYTEEPAIVHYCGFQDWRTNLSAPRKEYFKKYSEMSWDEALKLHANRQKKAKRGSQEKK